VLEGDPAVGGLAEVEAEAGEVVGGEDGEGAGAAVAHGAGEAFVGVGAAQEGADGGGEALEFRPGGVRGFGLQAAIVGAGAGEMAGGEQAEGELIDVEEGAGMEASDGLRAGEEAGAGAVGQEG